MCRASSIFWLSCLFVVMSALSPAIICAADFFNLPPTLPPAQYGDILIDRSASRNGVKPVLFSHWVHRQKYNCGVCHTELGFNMEKNGTRISEAKIQSGQFCGACHNQKIAFETEGNCDRCHSGNNNSTVANFMQLKRKALPVAPYGNGIDWVQSLKRGLISPVRFLMHEVREMPFNKTLILEAEWSSISPAIFPHREHSEWMDCTMCHPDLFNIKKKTTKHFLMTEILKGNFCGVCHLNVAFPMDDCQRCHPGMEEM